MNNMKLENQVTGNIGMYYACYKLSCMGWNVMPTARNARGIDIIAYKKNGTDFIGIQVKTLSKRNPVPLGNSLDKVMGEFWIIVNNVTIAPNSFIMLPAEIKTLAHKGEKNDAVSYWLQPTAYDKLEFREKWERIGYGHEMA
jgi:acetyltransferase-like isoleucine patch superfamily enzyme